MTTGKTTTTKLGEWMRKALAAGIMPLAVMQGQADPLYFSPAAEDTDLNWTNAEGWKLNKAPGGFVHRLPTEEDDVNFDNHRIALAGEGIEAPHALLVTNGVKAVAKSIRIATANATMDASYAKSGRVIGVEIGEGGFMHTGDDSESMTIGESDAGYGVLTMNGGMISNRCLRVGQYGIGVMTNIAGWVQMSSNDSLAVGSKAGSKGTLAMSGGVITHNRSNWDDTSVDVGVCGEGVFELSGGVVSNKVRVGCSSGGSGRVDMSGGQIVNRVFVGADPDATGDFNFTGGEIRGHICVGDKGRGRMTFDGGSHYCDLADTKHIVPDYVNARTYGVVVGNQSGSCGELILKKPGLTFYNGSDRSLNLLCGYFGEGHVQTYVNFAVHYLRVGGNAGSTSSYAAYANTMTTVWKNAYVGGYPLYFLHNTGTAEYPGNGELVLSNAVLQLTLPGGANVNQLCIGYYAGGFGVLRGCGTVQGESLTANSVRMALGNGQIIGDGFGEQRSLNLNTVVSVTNQFTNADDGTNGWYAVNKGGVLFPRVWMSEASGTRVIGSWSRNASPDFVNSVGFSVRGVKLDAEHPEKGYDLRGGVFAPDRDDVHAESLPKIGSVVGMWKLGLFTDINGYTSKDFDTIDLTFRYDHTKVRSGQTLKLYRWTGTVWQSVATKEVSGNPRILCENLAPISGETYNIGTFALMGREGFCLIIR